MSAYTHGARMSWTAETTIATEDSLRTRVPPRRLPVLALAALLAAGTGAAQHANHAVEMAAEPSTLVSESQAVDLTLTLVEAQQQELQTWIRTAGKPDAAGRNLSACIPAAEAGLVQPGQRVRAFPPDWKSSVYQARVSEVIPGEDCTTVTARLSGALHQERANYVMSIIVIRGSYLAIPNEAIIHEGDRQVVYAELEPGRYVPREIHTGLNGELYTEVLHGLSAGDRVVTLGSFFIDSEYKLKSAQQDAISNAHHHH